MPTAADYLVQSGEERQVRQALAAYKITLIDAHYGNCRHRVECWLGDADATRAERTFLNAEKHACSIANRSPEHQRWVRLISSPQPNDVREKDNFLQLVD